MYPGTIITIPGTFAVAVRIKTLNPRPYAALVERLEAYVGPKPCRALFKAAAEAITGPCDTLTRANLRRQLVTIDKRRDAATQQLAARAAKALEGQRG